MYLLCIIGYVHNDSFPMVYPHAHVPLHKLLLRLSESPESMRAGQHGMT